VAVPCEREVPPVSVVVRSILKDTVNKEFSADWGHRRLSTSRWFSATAYTRATARRFTGRS